MVDSVSRFLGFADTYDRARPRPPAELVDLLIQWSGVAEPDVVDLGAGTGLSTVVWEGRAQHVLAVEPSADMRAVAKARIAAFPDKTLKVIDANAEATGLPDECVDVITASQAMHWFDPAKVLPEIARLLRPGGVFAAYDVDWPPAIDAQVDAAFEAADEHLRDLAEGRDETPRWDKSGHLGRIVGSGLFRYARETCLHARETGDADRLLDLMRSQSHVAALLREGRTEDELGLTQLREIASERLAKPLPWWWTYRIRVAVK